MSLLIKILGSYFLMGSLSLSTIHPSEGRTIIDISTVKANRLCGHKSKH